MNLFAMPLDRFTAIIRVDGYTKKSSVIKLSVLFLFVVLIAVYAIIKASGMYTIGGSI